jgi:hypothetical protein
MDFEVEVRFCSIKWRIVFVAADIETDRSWETEF